MYRLAFYGRSPEVNHLPDVTSHLISTLDRVYPLIRLDIIVPAERVRERTMKWASYVWMCGGVRVVNIVNPAVG